MDFSGANKANSLSRQITRQIPIPLIFYNLKQGNQNMWEGRCLPTYFICLVRGYKN